MAAGTILITQGTQTGIPIDTVSGTTFPISKIDVGSVGVSVSWAGTAPTDALANPTAPGVLSYGLVWDTSQWQRLRGDLGDGAPATGIQNNSPMLYNGATYDRTPGDKIGGAVILGMPSTAWGTTINVTGTALGTIKPLVSGSVIYVTDLTISVPQTSNVAIFSGTAQVIAGTFYFAGNGGVAESYRIPIQTVSGSQLTYQQSGTGALSINAQGYVK